MHISPLPPLECLVAFEAAVRHRSFTRAARELHLSQSAVSRQISHLEEYLGRALFIREPRSLRLTPSAEQYAESIKRFLENCAEATAQVIKQRGDRDLTVACSSGISVLWMAPNLQHFRELHPDIKIRLIVRDALTSLTPSEFDIGIYYLKNRIPSLASRRLSREEVFPVCAPGYLGGAQCKPADLLSKTLLVFEDAQRKWMSWDMWFRLCGVDNPVFTDTISVNFYPALLEMAINGLGVALAWGWMIDEPLKSGALVRASRASASLGGGYHVVWPRERSEY